MNHPYSRRPPQLSRLVRPLQSSNLACGGSLRSVARLAPQKKASPAIPREHDALVRQLDAALSEDEIRLVLASALRGLSDLARAETAIADDLDTLAANMRPLIPRIIAAGAAPDFSFAEAIEDLNEDLFTGLADWLDPGLNDGCYLGPEVTSCLLEWEWTVPRSTHRGCLAATGWAPSWTRRGPRARPFDPRGGGLRAHESALIANPRSFLGLPRQRAWPTSARARARGLRLGSRRPIRPSAR